MAHIIVVGNEKGGAGKSTVSMHVATALSRMGHTVGVIDLVGNAVEPAPIADVLVARTIDHLVNNLAEQNRVPDMATRAGLSTDGFIKRFRAATGKTPGRYLQDLRLEKALALLGEGIAGERLARLRVLLGDRGPAYESAHLIVDTDEADPEEVAETVASRVREQWKAGPA